MKFFKFGQFVAGLALVPAALWAVTVSIPGGGTDYSTASSTFSGANTFSGAVTMSASTNTISGATNITGSLGLGGTRALTEYQVEVKKSMRVSGSAGSATTGKGIEFAGNLSNENFVTSYDRDGSAYMIMYINAAPLILQSNNAYVQAQGQFGTWKRTSAQIQALAPQDVGFHVFNTTLNLPCYSTATAAGSWAKYTDASVCW
jgi:hypothetical protein